MLFCTFTLVDFSRRYYSWEWRKTEIVFTTPRNYSSRAPTRHHKPVYTGSKRPYRCRPVIIHSVTRVNVMHNNNNDDGLFSNTFLNRIDARIAGLNWIKLVIRTSIKTQTGDAAVNSAGSGSETALPQRTSSAKSNYLLPTSARKRRPIGKTTAATVDPYAAADPARWPDRSKTPFRKLDMTPGYGADVTMKNFNHFFFYLYSVVSLHGHVYSAPGVGPESDFRATKGRSNVRFHYFTTTCLLSTDDSH